MNKVRTEMSLHVLAYNLKRRIRIFGVGLLMAGDPTILALSQENAQSPSRR
jgi:hypothetical protein